jgi:hypothetical protein
MRKVMWWRGRWRHRGPSQRALCILIHAASGIWYNLGMCGVLISPQKLKYSFGKWLGKNCHRVIKFGRGMVIQMYVVHYVGSLRTQTTFSSSVPWKNSCGCLMEHLWCDWDLAGMLTKQLSIKACWVVRIGLCGSTLWLFVGLCGIFAIKWRRSSLHNRLIASSKWYCTCRIECCLARRATRKLLRRWWECGEASMQDWESSGALLVPNF